MTTIAIKDGVMACDSLVSQGDMKTQFKFPKIIKVGDNIYGFAGSCHNILLVQEYLKGNIMFQDIPESVNIEYVSLNRKGHIMSHHICKGFSTQMPAPKTHALGSGGEYAMVAMRCGKSATEAVKIAIEFDCHSGGPVKSFSFKTESLKESSKEEKSDE
jgi:ATP-dependent protease HslVU (ClpYQ) peptidase subunit